MFALPTLRVRREQFEPLCDRNVDGRVAGAACNIDGETVPLADSGQDSGIERLGWTAAEPAAVLELYEYAIRRLSADLCR